MSVDVVFGSSEVQRYYFPTFTQDQSTLYLEGRPPRSFLIRRSQTESGPLTFVISYVKATGIVKHHRLFYANARLTPQGSNEDFDSIYDLLLQKGFISGGGGAAPAPMQPLSSSSSSASVAVPVSNYLSTNQALGGVAGGGGNPTYANPTPMLPGLGGMGGASPVSGHYRPPRPQSSSSSSSSSHYGQPSGISAGVDPNDHYTAVQINQPGTHYDAFGGQSSGGSVASVSKPSARPPQQFGQQQQQPPQQFGQQQQQPPQQPPPQQQPPQQFQQQQQQQPPQQFQQQVGQPFNINNGYANVHNMPPLGNNNPNQNNDPYNNPNQDNTEYGHMPPSL